MAKVAMKSYDHLFKILLIGDSGTDKPALLFRFANEAFNPTFMSTVGIDFKVRTIDLDGKRVKLQIWDTAGQERFRTITTAYFRGAMGIMLVYDITNQKTFDNVETGWIPHIKTYANEGTVVMLVGNKCEQDDRRQVPTSRGEKLAAEHGMKFIETSPKANINVDEAFYTLARDIYSKRAQTVETFSVNTKSGAAQKNIKAHHKEESKTWFSIKETVRMAFGFSSSSEQVAQPSLKTDKRTKDRNKNRHIPGDQRGSSIWDNSVKGSVPSCGVQKTPGSSLVSEDGDSISSTMMTPLPSVSRSPQATERTLPSAMPATPTTSTTLSPTAASTPTTTAITSPSLPATLTTTSLPAPATSQPTTATTSLSTTTTAPPPSQATSPSPTTIAPPPFHTSTSLSPATIAPLPFQTSTSLSPATIAPLPFQTSTSLSPATIAPLPFQTTTSLSPATIAPLPFQTTTSLSTATTAPSLSQTSMSLSTVTTTPTSTMATVTTLPSSPTTTLLPTPTTPSSPLSAAEFAHRCESLTSPIHQLVKNELGLSTSDGHSECPAELSSQVLTVQETGNLTVNVNFFYTVKKTKKIVNYKKNTKHVTCRELRVRRANWMAVGSKIKNIHHPRPLKNDKKDSDDDDDDDNENKDEYEEISTDKDTSSSSDSYSGEEDVEQEERDSVEENKNVAEEILNTV